jgi:hypothetical protein
MITPAELVIKYLDAAASALATNLSARVMILCVRAPLAGTEDRVCCRSDRNSEGD